MPSLYQPSTYPREAEPVQRPTAAPTPVQYLAGLDLGQAQDHTALVLAEWKRAETADEQGAYAVRAIERLPLGTTYPAVVARVEMVVQAVKQQQPAADVMLLVDYTGVGRPVADMIRASALSDLVSRLVLVTITGGDSMSRGEMGSYHVPKRGLASAVLVLLQSGRLKIAKGLPLAQLLTEELTGFRVKISLSGHDSYAAGEDWRSAPHDDLVLALAMMCWYGERIGRVRVELF